MCHSLIKNEIESTKIYIDIKQKESSCNNKKIMVISNVKTSKYKGERDNETHYRNPSKEQNGVQKLC
jgi:hypothetical protein